MDAVRQFIVTKTNKKIDTLREPLISVNYERLPRYELSYPSAEVKVQNIAPYDDDMRTRCEEYFPRGIHNPRSRGGRPRTLSLQPLGVEAGEWNENEGDVAFSMAISLYEEDLEEGGMKGDPIADCCAVVCSENYIIMVCADGCGWGDCAKTAARTAVLSMLRTLTREVLHEIYCSSNVFQVLREGVRIVQQDLIESNGPGLTTLCASVIAPLKYHNAADCRWLVCNVRVGDTATYRYCKSSKNLSLLSHRLKTHTRNMGDCGGCLGPVVGQIPDLTNMEYSISLADNNSTIFMSTDGVGDNFNPFVTKQLSRPSFDSDQQGLLHKVYCSCLNQDKTGNSCDLDDIPQHKELVITERDIQSHKNLCKCQRKQEDLPSCPSFIDMLSLKYLNQTINSYYEDRDVSVKEFVISICRMLIVSTDRKRIAMRRFQERLPGLSRQESDSVKNFHRKYIKTIPGKLDHASLVAVNLRRMRTLASPLLLSAEPRSSSRVAGFPISRSMGSLSAPSTPTLAKVYESEIRRGSVN